MSGSLKKSNFEDLKDINGGQVFFSITENGPSWYVPWPNIEFFFTHSSEKSAITRAKSLGVDTEIKCCLSPEKAQALAELTPWRYKIAPRLGSLTSI